MTGTVVVLAILLILLTTLPKPGTNSLVNATTTCDEVSKLNSGDAMAFWVSRHSPMHLYCGQGREG